MTYRTFGAPSPMPRRCAPACDRDGRPIARRAWLLARFIRRQPVRFELYRSRFRRSPREYDGDIAAIRRARIVRGTTVLGA